MDVTVIAVAALVAVCVVACVAIRRVSRPAPESFAEREMVRVLDRLMSAFDMSLEARRVEADERAARPVLARNDGRIDVPAPQHFDGIQVPSVDDMMRSNGLPVG